MPLVNVIQGERIDTAPLNVRTPILRLPIWLVMTWWFIKGAARIVYLACRYWYLTGPALVLLWLYSDFGWYGPAGLVLVLAGALTGWWFGHRPSCERFALYPALGRWRRMTYRRRWLPAMATTKLAVAFDGATVLPVLLKVRSNRSADRLTVRVVTGQIPDDFAAAAERLAHTFGALGARVTAGDRPDRVVIVLRRRDALAATVAPFPVPDVPDFTALPLGTQEDGETYALRLFGTQVLVVGATDAGKGSVVWSLLRALAGGIWSGLVQVWAFDPKGGMELAAGLPLFARFACEDFDAMADMLEEAVATMRERTARLRGVTRQHIPTVDDPLYLIIIDELATLTAYLIDRKLKDRIKAALGILLTQGRAVGVHVVACLQDPRKEVLPFRDLFPTRIGLRLTEETHVDLTLGEGARDRGALCDRIPKGPAAAGTAYVVLDGDPSPMRMRFSYLTDDDITDLARDYGRLWVVDGDWTEGGAA
jgi:S-DNA-T family DNA segregation ATPase FtsK/SpoIIIE